MKKRAFIWLLTGLTAVLIACGDDTPPQATTVAEMCSLPVNSLVQLEGNLNLPLFLTCQEGRCGIRIASDGTDISTHMRASDNPSENMMQLPPDPYTPDDLTVVFDDGVQVMGKDTAVLATGRVSTFGGGCILTMHSIQQP